MHISQTILTNLNKFCVGDKILVCVHCQVDEAETSV